MTPHQIYRKTAYSILIFLGILVLFPPNQTVSVAPIPDLPASIQSPDYAVGQQARISSMGAWNNANFDANTPAVAYNSQDDSFLVVWSGDDETDGDFEIWGQLVDAETMNQIGTDFRISTTGNEGETNRSAESPDVAYNPTTNEFLVVWQADALTDNRYEVFGRTVNGSTGATPGFQFRYSVMEPDGNDNFDAKSPAVAYNSTWNEFAVVWWGDTTADSLIDNENEIWAIRIHGGGGVVVGSQIRISDMGDIGDDDYDARYPDIAFNPSTNQYLVVWESDEIATGFQDDDYEIWGQCLTYTLAEVYINDRLLSDMGSPTEHWADAERPAVTYNADTHDYLVVWHGDDNVDGKYDVYGQIVSNVCVPTSPNDFLISEVIVGPNPDFDAFLPDVTWNALYNEYVVVFMADKAGVGAFEIWAQRISSTATMIKHNIPISIMGTPNDTTYLGFEPAAAYSEITHNISLITWYGDHTVDGKMEVWVRRFGGPYKTQVPVVMRD